MSGLRDHKKQQSRQLIADTARELFAEGGSEAVTVTAVARAADVTPQNVYNYLPTQEDLFYSRLEAFENELVDAVRTRAPGETVLAAFARFILARQGVMQDTERLRTVTRVITES